MTAKEYTLTELAERVGAQLRGEQSKRLHSVAPLNKAGPEQLAFCTSNRYLDQLKSTRAGAVLLNQEHAELCPVPALIVKDPYYAYAELANLLHPRAKPEPGVHPTAVVSEQAVIGKGVSIGPGAIVSEGCRIGEGTEIGAGAFLGTGVTLGPDCWLAPGVRIMEGCRIGERVLLHPGVVIGADGFGIAPGPKGWRKVPQLGIVAIGNDVEIGANSTVDRGALEDTVIEDGVKLDNLVHIAHNVRIGSNTAIAGCTVVAGSSTIGKNCILGGQSAITGHINICDGVTIMGMTGVTNSISEPGVYSSPIPARPVKAWRKNVVRFMQLDEIFRRLKAVEKHLGEQKPSDTPR